MISDRAGPTGQVLAVEDIHETGGVVLAQDRVGLRGGNLTDEDIPPADLAAVRLELNGRLLEQGNLAVPEVLQPGVIDHELVVQPDRRAFADLQDTKTIPLAERLIGQDERVLAGRAGAVVPQAARALVGPTTPLAAFP